MKKRKIVIILVIIALVFLIGLSFLIYNKYYTTGKSVTTQNNQNAVTAPAKVVPLSAEQKEKVVNTIQSSEMIKDIPEKGIVSIKFFSFEDGQRVWSDNFLLGKNEILSSGKPDFQIIVHSKYIEELNENNLCEVFREAKQNGDIGFYSEKNKAALFLKYTGMLGYRDCFGI